MSITDGTVLGQTELRKIYQTIPASYIVYKSGSTYYANATAAGGTDYDENNMAAVIQDAIDALGTNGGKIFIKAGNYGISETINLTSSITLEGEAFTEIVSPKATHLTMGADTYMFETKGYGITLRNLLLDGARGTYANSGLIYAGATDSFYTTIENCLLVAYGTKHAIYTKLGGDHEAWTIRNCIINTYDKTLGIYGIWFNEGGGHRIYNNEIASSDRGIRLYQCDNVQIGGVMNYFYDCGRAIEYEDVDRLILGDNSFDGNTLNVVPMGTNTNVIIKPNLGYRTENSGTGTITASTSVAFPHLLAGTPTHVNIGFKTTGYGSWYWAADADNISLYVTNNGTYDFSWYAEYKP